MENTLFYFFSTIAQSFAALTAFVFAAAQMRISWLDSKITAQKYVLVVEIYGNLDPEYHSSLKTASEIVEHFKNSTGVNKNRAIELAKSLEQIQELRNSVTQLLKIGIGTCLTGLVILPFSVFISKDPLICWSVIIIGLIISIYSSLKILIFITQALDVSLKKKVY